MVCWGNQRKEEGLGQTEEKVGRAVKAGKKNEKGLTIRWREVWGWHRHFSPPLQILAETIGVTKSHGPEGVIR